MIILAQNLPTFETLLSTEPGRLLFVVFILSQLVLVYVSFRQAGAAAGALAELKAEIKEVRQLKDDLDDSYLTISTFMERVLDQLQDNDLTNADMLKAVGEMLVESATLHAETRKMVSNTLASEMAEATEKVLFQRGAAMLSSVFQFPAPNDCRWKQAIIKWRFDNRTARIFKTPLYNYDGNIIGEVSQGGQVVKIIEHTLLPGWASIVETTGDDPLSGYIDLTFVMVEPLPQKESKHE